MGTQPTMYEQVHADEARSKRNQRIFGWVLLVIAFGLAVAIGLDKLPDWWSGIAILVLINFAFYGSILAFKKDKSGG